MRWSEIKGQAIRDALSVAVNTDAYKATKIVDGVKVPVIPYGPPSGSDTGMTKGDILVTAMRLGIYGKNGKGGALKAFQAEMHGKLKNLPEMTKRIRSERQPKGAYMVDPGIEATVGRQTAGEEEKKKREIEEYKASRSGVSF